MNNYEFILKDKHSNKVFHLQTSTTTKASVKSRMHYNLCYLERTVYMFPYLEHNSLMSAIKFADENYITVLMSEEVLIDDVNEIKLQAPGQAILTGWR